MLPDNFIQHKEEAWVVYVGNELISIGDNEINVVCCVGRVEIEIEI